MPVGDSGQCLEGRRTKRSPLCRRSARASGLANAGDLIRVRHAFCYLPPYVEGINDQVGLAGAVPAKARLVSGNGTAGQLSAGASAPRNRGKQRLTHEVDSSVRQPFCMGRHLFR